MSNAWQLVIFFAIASTVWALAHWYVARRLIEPLGLPRPLRRRSWVVAGALFSLSPLVMWGDRALGQADWVTAFRWVAYTYMGLFSLLFAFFLLRDVLLLPLSLVKHAQGRISEDDSLPESHAEGRRHFLINVSNAAIGGISGLLTGWGLVEARRVAEVVEVDVPIEGLHPGLEGYRIAQVTDIHVGPTIKGDWLESVVDRVNDLNPDLIAVTGDLIDGTVEHLRHQVAPLGELRAPDGAFFVTGNHEYYWDAEAWCAEVARLGLTVLNNAHTVVRRGSASVVVAGVTDYTSARHLESHVSDPQMAIDGAPEAHLKLLLAHQPKTIVAAERAGFDLQVSGHTHGGQYFPWNLFVGLVHPFSVGLHPYRSTLIYVSPGTGYWGPPTRAGVPSEITLLRLTSGDAGRQHDQSVG